MKKMIVFTELEIAGIISVLANHWEEKDIRIVMRYLSSRATSKIGKEETQRKHE